MASVYKSLSKSDAPASKDDALSTGPKNRQRVLILSSRGITYRYAHPLVQARAEIEDLLTDCFPIATVTSSTTYTPSSLTAAKTQN